MAKSRKIVALTPDWVTLYHYVVQNDVQGLSLLDARLFLSQPKEVLRQLRKVKAISLPICEMIIRDIFSLETSVAILHEFHMIRLHFEDKPILVEDYIGAMKYRYGTGKIRQVITEASEVIREKDPYDVARKLVSDLDLTGLSVTRARSLKDVADEAAERENVVLETGLPQFKQIGIPYWFTGNLMTIGGPSGSFKTTYALEIMVRALEHNPLLHGVYFSKEQPAHEILHKLMARFAQTEYTTIQHMYNGHHPDFREKIRSELMKKPLAREIWKRLRILDFRDFSTAEDLCDILRTHAATLPPNASLIWTLDYVSRLRFSDRGRNDAVVDALNLMKDTAMATNSLGILLSQLKKDWDTTYGQRTTKRETFQMPRRNDLIWSSELPNLSSHILLLVRPGEALKRISSDFLFIRVDKARFRNVNALVLMRLVGEHQYFDRLTEAEQDEMRIFLKLTKGESSHEIE